MFRPAPSSTSVRFDRRRLTVGSALARVGAGSRGSSSILQRVFMIRPWKVAVAVVLGVAALPGSAMAQAPDTTPPAITITSPVDGTSYTVGQAVPAQFTCVDSESQVPPTCTGT